MEGYGRACIGVVDDVPPVEELVVGALHVPAHVDRADVDLVDVNARPVGGGALLHRDAVPADVPRVADEEGEVLVPEEDVVDVARRAAAADAVGVLHRLGLEHGRHLPGSNGQ